ncbi:microtubule-associated protein futsch-like isoform X4 [Frieseomelitta varia]|uniref:microtubule-associated protein futsch-like isoform X4 n=1 Tax=Frieseomelitta varia TaxID=561572 RepID=UPI001CB693BE|nr:microtubule-associated protein futsch-like isoform X4 [Frieseomelitta varia]
MGCVREASPPPQNHHHHHHHHHQNQHQPRTLGLGEYSAQNSVDPLPKEPKKRRFHPLRGLRKIFRRKSRGAADARLVAGHADHRDAELVRLPREDITDRHPAGRPEEARSRSASELLTDSSDRESVFLRRTGVEDSFAKLRGGAGKLSVSHDSVFPGEVPHTRPLSSLASLATLERRQTRKSNEIEHKEYNQHVVQRHRISLRVLEQIKTVIENRNQLASATSSDTTSAAHAVGERYQQETAENRVIGLEKQERNGEETQAKGKVEEKRFESTRSTCKIEDRARAKPESRRAIPQATKEQSVRAEDTIEVIDQIASSDDSCLIGGALHVTRYVARTMQDKKTAEDDSAGFVRQCRIEDRGARSKPETRQRIPPVIKDTLASPRAEEAIEGSKSPKDAVDRVTPVAKEDLPQLESASLNHTAAHHRISVRPKNRRPPRRTGSQTANTSTSTITTIAEDSLDSLGQQNSNASSPTESKNASVTRKSSSRLSRTSDIFEELEAKLPRKPSSVASLSPDSLDAVSGSRTSVEVNEEQPDVRPVVRKPSNRTPKNTEMFEELESRLPRRRSSNRLSKSPDSLEVASSWFSKSTEGFDKLTEYEEAKPVTRRLLNPISKSTDRVFKSSDSLEAIEALTSDESFERRRSSFELRARRSSKSMSKSSESFEVLEQTQMVGTETSALQESLQKRSSISDMNLSRGRRLSKSISKSSEDFERIEISELKDEEENVVVRDSFGNCRRRSSKRMSSESSDNLESDDKLENRRARRTPMRIPSTSYVDIVPADSQEQEEEKRPIAMRKPSRLQKSSESSELGSTDTLDSERRNKSSESTETLDSLERDMDQDRKQEDLTDAVADRRDKNDTWTNKPLMTSHSDQISMADGMAEDSRSLISPDKFYWRQTSESKENIDIHQLLAITIVTRMADNGNNQRSSVIYPKKKQQITTSQPTSPVAKQEDNKMIFDNLLVSKNDEDLQNMLNGNISEVSTDTKSFKEKLIMFEKLGK